MLINVDNCEQCGQHSIVQSCYTPGSEFLHNKKKMINLFSVNENMIEQCFAAYIFQCCQQSCLALLHLI